MPDPTRVSLSLTLQGWVGQNPGNEVGGGAAARLLKEGDLATMSLEFEFYLQFPCGSPLTWLSDFHQSARM